MNLPPTIEKGQRSQSYENYLFRLLPQWLTPDWLMSERWRVIVRNQPVAMICKETLISNVLALDWRIEPRDSNKRDELKSDIDYYTRFLESNPNIEYSNLVEWIGQDYLDLPFGAAVEVGHEGDKPEGKILWIQPLDGATLFPTLNNDYPVGQKVEGVPSGPVYFPAHAIDRVYMSPRTEYRRQGWGMAPPEKIYLGLEMLNRGDMYYANLLLDTPEAGLLDLGDMEKAAAEDWVQGLRGLLTGIDPFKIPVLYEHTTPVNWIPFTRPPTDIIYDRVMMQKASIVTAGYGMSLGDIGVSMSSNGGDTMAGSIRQERKTRKTGFAKLKKAIQAFFNRMLPSTLQFIFIDYDEELNVAISRARLANSTAYGQMITNRILTPHESRLQSIADGLITISIPEEPDLKEFDVLPTNQPKANERPGMLGNPQPVSTGGQGESTAGTQISMRSIDTTASEQSIINLLRDSFSKMSENIRPSNIRKIIRLIAPDVFSHVTVAMTELSTREELGQWQEWYQKALYGDGDIDVVRALEGVYDKVDDTLKGWTDVDIDDETLETILTMVYLHAIRKSANDMVSYLYEIGNFTEDNVDNLIFNVTNKSSLLMITNRVKDLINLINEGTRYYFKRIIVGKLRDKMLSPDIVQKLRTGLDISTLLDDNVFMGSLVQDIMLEFESILNARTFDITRFELNSMFNIGRLDQFMHSGLETKQWVHVGADQPCEYCVRNELAGVVPIEYMYASPFGTCAVPPCHPNEHCVIEYNTSELTALAESGNFRIWTGD